jgi:hypothetical protein
MPEREPAAACVVGRSVGRTITLIFVLGFELRAVFKAFRRPNRWLTDVCCRICH